MKKSILGTLLVLVFNTAYCQSIVTSAATGGLKYPLLEAAVGTWNVYTPDADQDVLQDIKPVYSRAIIAFWHGYLGSGDPMIVTGDPFCTGTGYISALPTATIDRETFGGVIAQNRPWESYVGTEYTLTPNYDVSLNCSYNVTTKVISITVTGTALATLSGNWNINAYVVEDSISSGLSSTYNQANSFNPPGSMSCTGSPSWYIGDGNPITSGALYSHMQVVEAILCSGASVWGESAFTNPTIGTIATKTYTYTIPGTSKPKNIKIIGLVQKFGSLTTDRAIENAIEVTVDPPTGGPLTFSGGHTQSMTVCENSGANSINSLLAAFDGNTGTTVNWSVYAGAVHGSLIATYTTTSTGGTLTPTGLSYTPTTGYSGPDSYKIIVSDGTLADTTTVNVTVNPSPTPITGITSICIGNTSSLSSTPLGGTWTSSITSVATIGYSSGSLYGVSPGTSIITYEVSGCSTTVNANVSSSPTAGTITGLANVCTGATITLTDAITGGTWTSGSGDATIGLSSGVVTGVSVGTTLITYTVTYTCGTATATKLITIGLPPVAGTITGLSTVCTGGNITLSDAAGSGVWSASNGSGTVSGSGIVHGVTAGVDTIGYTVTNTCGTATVTSTVTINHCPLDINIPENPLQTELDIFPNPATTELTIRASYKISNVMITNLVGQRVYNNEYSSENVQVNVSNLPPGVYFIKVNGSDVRKFVKQ